MGANKETSGRVDWEHTVGMKCPFDECGGILVSRVSPKGDLVVIVCNENFQHFRIALKEEAEEALKETNFWYW